MVVGYHLIWTAYGWWLPNDPRGSSSQEIRVKKLSELGPLHEGRKTIQPPGRDIRRFYDEAKDLLNHELLTFSTTERQVIANAFSAVLASCRYTCYACAIMPDHIHLLIRRHRDRGETMIANLQEESRQGLISAGFRSAEHPVWGGPGWKRFLNSRADIERVVKYVRRNPTEIGMPEQDWPFVSIYDGWLPRPSRET